MARDPYLEWTVANAFAGHAAASAADAPVHLLVEADATQRSAFVAAGARILPAYDGNHTRYFTATVSRSAVAQCASKVARIEFALPVANAGGDKGQPDMPSLRGPVAAVIDRGCAFLNRVFGGADGTRIVALWEQGKRAQAGSAWTAPPEFGYGRELVAREIDGMIEQLRSGRSESELYREADYLFDDGALAAARHGTHVLDTFAGRVDASVPVASAKPDEDDAASAAPIIFVDTPALGPDDTTGAAPGAYLLDALHFIRRRAGADVDVVVNISLGALAGPHDGTSLAELAIDDFLRRDGRMALTVAAGNAALAPWHAHGVIGAQGSADAAPAFGWRVLPDDPTDSFCEVWLHGDDTSGVEARLVSPFREASGWCKLGGEALLPTDPGSRPPTAAVFGCTAVTTPGDAMFLFAMAPCAGRRGSAAAGLWRVELRNTGSGPIVYDAWVQREEPGIGGPSLLQSFIEIAFDGDVQINGSGALSSLATGDLTVVVGAADLAGRPAPYSVRGVDASPSRRGVRDIDAFATADDGPAGQGLLAAGVLTGTAVSMAGTSVAAPVLARRLLCDIAGAFDVSGGLAAAARRHVAAVSKSRPSVDQEGFGAKPLWRPRRAAGLAHSFP